MDKKVNYFDSKAYAFWNRDLEVVKKSSSGGAFTTFANVVLDDGGVVYGAAFNDANRVTIQRIDKKEELEKIRGSKYVRAYLENSFVDVKNDLINGKKVLFSGTPCQIFALKHYVKDVDTTFLFCIDIVCHGTPTHILLDKYIDFFQRKYKSDVASFQFRYKKKNQIPFLRVMLSNGQIFEEQFHPKINKYAKFFYSNVCLLSACNHCRFKTLQRVGDITIGDFWGIEAFPEIKSNVYGNSLVLVNSKKGENMLKSVSNISEYYQVDVNSIVRYNPPLSKDVIPNPLNKLFLKSVRRYRFSTLYYIYCIILPTLIAPYRVFRKIKYHFS